MIAQVFSSSMATSAARLLPALLMVLTACSSPPTSPPPSASPTSRATNPYATLDQTDLDRRLLTSAAEDDVTAARDLIEAGADPDVLDHRHDTAWLITGVTGSVAMAKVLLTAEYVVKHTDIDIDHVNDLGWTALLEAVVLGKGTERWQRIVRALVDAGADVSIPDKNGVTALQHARNRGFDEIVAILQEG
jgi:ankyrin repeat protein